MINVRNSLNQKSLLILLALLIIITGIISLGFGYSSISFTRIIHALLGQGTFKEEFVLYSIRLPRILITILAGMALAVSGAILQGLTKNDLADPGIIGVNAGAGVGVALFFLYFPVDADSFIYVLPLIAFISAFLIAALIYLFSYNKEDGLQPIRLILVGVGFSVACSGFMMILIASSEREKVDFIAKWLAGSIWGTDWPFILAVLPWLLLLIPYTFIKAKKLLLINFHEDVATNLGIQVEKERLYLLVTAVGLAAAAVSVTGGIAFIGLMAPHLAKNIIGAGKSLYLPVSMLIGGFLLLISDTIGRNLAEPEGVAAGIMTALIGAPYFICLLLRKNN